MSDENATDEQLEGARNDTLFGSEQLTPEEASRLLARGPGRLVVLMGEAGAGKTTLATELYERQRRVGSTARIAGSWTLLALEQLAARRRADGALPPAGRDRVDPSGREILHLALASGDEPLHLLLGDLPGELFRKLADNQLDSSELPWLHRADKLVLLVDGAQLCDPGTRSSPITRVRQLAERLAAFGLPHAQTRVALLVSKWDLVREQPGALAYWEPREAELLADLRALDPHAVALRVSAPTGALTDELAPLRDWLLEVSPSNGIAAALDWDTPLREAFPVGAAAANQLPAAADVEFTWPDERPRRRWRPWRWRR